MSNYPMVDEVNRLVGNLLAAGSGVFLFSADTVREAMEELAE